ncbi:exodeoxyribonuclease VII large subunit [Psychrobacillus lasiicapitis]|uniref:Exodeoxyribonuclease 7 large subunit n=1 Tax=Psychrobacillus lasiicapitis TaxID=1636719 RepID=A0A544TAM8_9BACI|nr:exodeoxyribonuclease VII large subunit [Psychrobacillus lasiicapitis]TQR14517.1 exodeoxyribonuclease VII large subunit [Psychrobacillus lasiicapitis]GGA30695.1 exodeoxyribonuclease 7 large subunit [Psychrobacillus lasiicapitis]
MTSHTYLTVKALTKYIKRKFDADTHLRDVYVKGELSNVKVHSSGHIYFTLKDDAARVTSVMFAMNARSLKFIPESGMNVLIRGDINVFEAAGQYQLYATSMQPDGIGELFLAFEQLKKKLEKEGLFHPSRKKPIPSFPKKIGVVTSKTGAAIRDILTTLERRYPLSEVIVFPSIVQGPQAAPSIVKSIEQANSLNSIDVLIVGRGGGSIEDLWAFNEEVVARAIANSDIPIISAVGHETDTTIADFVSDLRAPTPTAAAEMAVPSKENLMKNVLSYQSACLHFITKKLADEKNRFKRAMESPVLATPEKLYRPFIERYVRAEQQLQRETSRLYKDKKRSFTQIQNRFIQLSPQKVIDQHQRSVQTITNQLNQVAISTFEKNRHQFISSIRTLEALNPLKIMDRGYSIAYKNGKLVKSVTDVQQGDSIVVTLSDGRIEAIIQEVDRNERGD